MLNANLSRAKSAKSAKSAEFYTQFRDIESEMKAYLGYDPDAFRGKTVFLPCDNPEWWDGSRTQRCSSESYKYPSLGSQPRRGET